jgi:hypothetical protein
VRAALAVLAAFSVRAALARVERAALAVRAAFSVRAALARAVLALRDAFTGGNLRTAALALARLATCPVEVNGRPFTLFIAAAAGLPWFTEANWALLLCANCWCANWLEVGETWRSFIALNSSGRGLAETPPGPLKLVWL